MNKRENEFLIASVIVCILVFFIDLFIPLGYAAWLLYVLPILLGFQTQNKPFLFILLSLIALLFILGITYSTGTRFIIAVLNRIAAFLTLLVFSVIISSLIDARKRLELKALELMTTNKELESFTYSVAHDLRSPLMTIKGFFTIFSEDYSSKLDDEANDLLKRGITITDNMNVLINDMLTLSKSSRGTINKQIVNLSLVARSIIDELQKGDPDRSVELRIQENITAMADENLIRIALTNLLSNAWKYTSKRETAYIEFGVTNDELENSNFKTITRNQKQNTLNRVFFVKDNGVGFDMQNVSRVFEPFQRLHSAKEFPGTGIGLATVKRILERHGGSVWAESEMGKGTIFYFTILPD
jgi:signal transduction histidine kinase